jgi:hypothetical protein
MSQIESSICGPSGVRPRKESAPDFILMAVGSAVFLIAFSAFGRALRTDASTWTPRLNWAWMAGVLVVACAVGIVVSNRRYR